MAVWVFIQWNSKDIGPTWKRVDGLYTGPGREMRYDPYTDCIDGFPLIVGPIP